MEVLISFSNNEVVATVLYLVLITLLLLIAFICNKKPKELNSGKVKTHIEPRFVVVKIEQYNSLIAKYVVLNNFQAIDGGNYINNKFAFYDSVGKYNIGDILKFGKMFKIINEQPN